MSNNKPQEIAQLFFPKYRIKEIGLIIGFNISGF